MKRTKRYVVDAFDAFENWPTDETCVCVAVENTRMKTVKRAA
jgi:hypothetical protein